MPEPKPRPDRTPAELEADHQAIARLSETLVPALVAKLASSGLGELEVREGDWRIRLRRSGAAGGGPAAARRPERARGAASGVHATFSDGPRARDAAVHAPEVGAPDGVPAEPDRVLVTSPAVGVFGPGPAVGTRVRAGDRIATVDLLGIPQEVLSPIDGRLVDVFVGPGEAVEYGEDLAAVQAEDPAADEPDGEA